MVGVRAPSGVKDGFEEKYVGRSGRGGLATGSHGLAVTAYHHPALPDQCLPSHRHQYHHITILVVFNVVVARNSSQRPPARARSRYGGIKFVIDEDNEVREDIGIEKDLFGFLPGRET